MIFSPKTYWPIVISIAGLIIISLAAIPPIVSGYITWAVSPPALLDPSLVSPYPWPRDMRTLTSLQNQTPISTDWLPDQLPQTSTTNITGTFTLTFPSLDSIPLPVQLNSSDITSSAAHFPGTALPGTFGNTVIFGHSRLPVFYKPESPLTVFNRLLQLQSNDIIEIEYQGLLYRYRIYKIYTTSPSDLSYLTQKLDRQDLTLITCVPLGTYLKRLVVMANLIE